MTLGTFYGMLLFFRPGSALVLRGHSEMGPENQDLRTLQEIAKSPVSASAGDSGPDVAPLSDCHPSSCDDQEALKCYLSEENIEVRSNEEDIPVEEDSMYYKEGQVEYYQMLYTTRRYYTAIVDIMSEVANFTGDCLVKDLTQKEIYYSSNNLPQLIDAMYKVMKACKKNTTSVIITSKYSSTPSPYPFYAQYFLSSKLETVQATYFDANNTLSFNKRAWTCDNVEEKAAAQKSQKPLKLDYDEEIGDSGPDVAPLPDCHPRSCDDEEALKCYLRQENIEVEQNEDGVPVGDDAEYYNTIVNIMSEVANFTGDCLVKDLTQKEIYYYHDDYSKTILEPLIDAMYKVMKACEQNTTRVIITSKSHSEKPNKYKQYLLILEAARVQRTDFDAEDSLSFEEHALTCEKLNKALEKEEQKRQAVRANIEAREDS